MEDFFCEDFLIKLQNLLIKAFERDVLEVFEKFCAINDNLAQTH